MRWIFLTNSNTFVKEERIEQIIKRDSETWLVWLNWSEDGDDWENCEPKFYDDPFKGV